MSTRDRALGAFTGLALGDALGMPTQSMSREDIAAHYGPVRSLADAVPAQPISPGLPAGSITDDTEQAVLVAGLLIDGGGLIDPGMGHRGVRGAGGRQRRAHLRDRLRRGGPGSPPNS